MTAGNHVILRRVVAYLRGERAGVLEETPSGGSRFTYDPAYLAASPAPRPLGPGLPPRPEPYESPRLHPVFANLVPKGNYCEMLARRDGARPGDHLGALLAIGAGTIQFHLLERVRVGPDGAAVVLPEAPRDEPPDSGREEDPIPDTIEGCSGFLKLGVQRDAVTFQLMEDTSAPFPGERGDDRKVIPLFGNPEGANPHVVGLCEDLLRRAKAGQIRSIAACAIWTRPEAYPAISYMVDEQAGWPVLLGAVTLLRRELEDTILRG